MVGISFFGSNKPTPAVEKKPDSKPQSNNNAPTTTDSTPLKTHSEADKQEDVKNPDSSTDAMTAASRPTDEAEKDNSCTKAVVTPAAADTEPTSPSDVQADAVQSEQEPGKDEPQSSNEVSGAGEETVPSTASDAPTSAKMEEKAERPKPATRDSMGDKFKQAIHWDHRERHFPSMHHRKRPE